MERQYELALERIQELEEKYMDLKAEYALLKDQFEEYSEIWYKDKKKLKENFYDIKYKYMEKDKECLFLTNKLSKVRELVK